VEITESGFTYVELQWEIEWLRLTDFEADFLFFC